jgi:hypothetical protein
MSFEWINKKNPKTIEMTVALPSYKAKNIIWIALESLRLQENITFGWELIIYEENNESSHTVKQFLAKLPLCQRIKYKSLNPSTDGRKNGKFKGRVLLIDKWYWIMLDRSPTSKIYVMHAADDYSPSNRLATHYKHFTTDKNCIFSTQKRGVFYNIRTGRKVVYNGTDINRTHLNMAYSMTYFNKIDNNIEQNSGIDNHIKSVIEKKNNIKLTTKNIRFLDNDDKLIWRSGLFTDGCNTISLNRKNIYTHITPPYIKYQKNYQIWNNIPNDVRSYLHRLGLALKVKVTHK